MTTFGIEIEIVETTTTGNRLTVSSVAAALNQHGVAAVAEGYNHATRTHWKVITDGSCGLEIVSPVLDPSQGDQCWNDIVRVCTALSSIGAKVTSACGLHVHLYCADKTPKQIAKFVGMYLRMEHLIDLAMPKSRRSSNNRFCRSVVNTFNAGSTVRGYFRDATSNDEYVARANQAIDATRKARTVQGVSRIVNLGGDRYFKLNMQAFSRQGTIEVRHHSGTTNAKKITMWVRFLLSMMRRAESAKFVRDLCTTQIPAGNAWHILWAMDDPAACQWLKGRIMRFQQLEAQVQDEDLALAMGQ